MSVRNFEQIESGSPYPFKAFVAAIENSCFHWHYEYELLLVLKGSLTVYCSPKPIRMGERDLLLINPKTVHAITHTEENNICLLLQMNPSLLQTAADDKVAYHFYLNSAQAEISPRLDTSKFIQTLVRIALLELKKETRSHHRMLSLIYQVIADLFDCVEYDMNYRSPSARDDSSLMMEIIEYMQENLREGRILENLCDDLSLNRKAVYRLLKDNIGLSPKELVDTLRIDRAKQLLKYTQKSIGFVADECGLGSESSFYRIFKQKTGFTPNECRKGHLPVDKNPEIQGYLNFGKHEAQTLLTDILEEG